MTTLQERILEKTDKEIEIFLKGISEKDESGNYWGFDTDVGNLSDEKGRLKQFIFDSIKEVQEETRKETIELIKQETLISGIPKSNFGGINWIGQDNLIQSLTQKEEEK